MSGPRPPGDPMVELGSRQPRRVTAEGPPGRVPRRQADGSGWWWARISAWFSRAEGFVAARTGILPVLLVLAGCAPGPAPRGTPVSPSAEPACWDLRYRVRFGDGEQRGSGRLVVRACRDGRLLAEVRGRVGAPVLVAAVRGGRVRLLLPRRREAVDGPDVAATWERWTGIPLPGAMLLERRSRREGGRRSFRVGAWSGNVAWAPAGEDACPYPVRLAARDEGGGFLVAERIRARPARAAPAWPPVPPGFVHRREEGAVAAEPSREAGR